MNHKKIKDLSTTIESVDTAKFYTVNGWGIVSFKSDIDFTASRNAVCFMDGTASMLHSSAMVKELNDAIKPVLVKYSELASSLIKKELKPCE